MRDGDGVGDGDGDGVRNSPRLAATAPRRHPGRAVSPSSSKPSPPWGNRSGHVGSLPSFPVTERESTTPLTREAPQNVLWTERKAWPRQSPPRTSGRGPRALRLPAQARGASAAPPPASASCHLSARAAGRTLQQPHCSPASSGRAQAHGPAPGEDDRGGAQDPNVLRRPLQVMPSPRSSARGRQQTAGARRPAPSQLHLGHRRGPCPLASSSPGWGVPRFRPGVPGGSTLGFNVRAVLGAGRPVTLPVSSRCCGTTSLRVPDGPLWPPARPYLCVSECWGDRLSLGAPPPAGGVTASCLRCLMPSAPRNPQRASKPRVWGQRAVCHREYWSSPSCRPNATHGKMRLWEAGPPPAPRLRAALRGPDESTSKQFCLENFLIALRATSNGQGR